MNSRTKKILMISGLIVCVIIAVLSNPKVSQLQHEITYNITIPARITQVISNTDTKWIIQTTYTLLKSNSTN